jgi:hypothetical protein
MNDEKDNLRIRFEYQQRPDSRLEYAHGVWGGINPQGEIELNFYIESDKLPPYSERILTPEGDMGHETAPQEDPNFKVVNRYVHSRLLLNYHTARAVQDWLQEKIEALESEMDDMMFIDDDSGMKQ